MAAMNYNHLKCADLKQMLLEHGLPSTGNKAALICRLQENAPTALIDAIQEPAYANQPTKNANQPIENEIQQTNAIKSIESAIQPDDSVSQTNKSSITTSTTTSSRVRVAAKKAAALAKMRLLEKKHAIQVEQLNASRDLERLELEI